MKRIILLTALMFSINSFPGDKGNLAGVINLGTTAIETIMNMAFEIEESLYLPLTNKEVVKVGHKTSLTGLDLLTAEDAHVEFSSVVVELIKRGEKEILNSLVFNNENFISAFSVVALKSSINQDNSLSVVEKTALNKEIDQKFVVFWGRVRFALRSQLSEGTVNQFMNDVQALKLGYLSPI